MCVSHNSLKLEKWSFWLEFEQKKGNCQTSKHSITLHFTLFHLFLLSKGRHSKAIFIHCGAVSSKWDLFWRVLSTVCAPNASHLFKCLATKIRLLEGFASPQCTPEMRNETILENFQPLCTWNETILKDFHPQWSWHNPKEALQKGQNSNFEWLLLSILLGLGIDWTGQLFVYNFLFVYIWVSCLFTFQFLSLFLSFGWTFQL